VEIRMPKLLERSLYETDFYAWTKEQAAELRALAARRVNSTLDLENLAEEVESSGRSDWRTARNQVERVLEHLLKLEVSPASPPRAQWLDLIDSARRELMDLLTPVLRREIEDDLATLFQRARSGAAKALRRYGEPDAADALPPACPYSFQQILDQDWYPRNRHGLDDDS
jgi:Domain of unknown function DUF29